MWLKSALRQVQQSHQNCFTLQSSPCARQQTLQYQLMSMADHGVLMLLALSLHEGHCSSWTCEDFILSLTHSSSKTVASFIFNFYTKCYYYYSFKYKYEFLNCIVPNYKGDENTSWANVAEPNSKI